MSAGVWYGKRTWLGLGFALVLALALDALGALLLARGMVPMAAARAWTLGSWAAGGFCGTRMAVRAECGSLPIAAAVPLRAVLLGPVKAKTHVGAPGKGRPAHRPMRRGAL